MTQAIIEKELSLNQKINVSIREHGCTAVDWELKDMAKEIYTWFDRFNKRFFDNRLEQSVISFEPTRISNLGHYHTELNGLGLQDNINLNYKQLKSREKWQVLSTLLHEMVHQYQRRIGTFSDKEHREKYVNYHNKEFLKMTETFGLIHNNKGHRIAMPKDPFVSFLKEYKVEITPERFAERTKGTSKLRKYSCKCEPAINIRVATSEFSATCNICKKEFEEQ